MAETPRILQAAWDEVVEGATYYEQRVPGLGDRPYDEFEDALDRIGEAPMAGALWTHRKARGAIRRVPLRRFPLSLFYVLEPRVVIVAFAHLKRRPGYRVERLRG